MKAVEALRIENQKLKKDLAAKIEAIKILTETIEKQDKKLWGAGARAMKLEQHLEIMLQLSAHYGFCNPELQIARMDVEQAGEHFWDKERFAHMMELVDAIKEVTEQQTQETKEKQNETK